jgi:hypothetical protein
MKPAVMDRSSEGCGHRQQDHGAQADRAAAMSMSHIASMSYIAERPFRPIRRSGRPLHRSRSAAVWFSRYLTRPVKHIPSLLSKPNLTVCELLGLAALP